VKTPPEIALQDSSEDFTPQISPTPLRRQTHMFERTQSSLFPSRTSPNKDPLDLSSLGISDRSPPYDNSTMDWTPSNQQTTFSHSTTFPRDTSIFALGRGALPPPPRTKFTTIFKENPISRSLTQSKDNFSDEDENSSPSLPSPRSKEIQFREQRFFAPQVHSCIICINCRNQLAWNRYWDQH
jgi:hypothetical protein